MSETAPQQAPTPAGDGRARRPARVERLLRLALDAGSEAPPAATADFGLGGARTGLAALMALLVVAFAARFGVAVLLPSVYFPDEVFQYWEQGYRLVFGYGIVPWEYYAGIRSWLVPGAIGGVIAVVDRLGGGPEVWRAAVQALLSLASLGIVATSFLWARRLAGTGAAILSAFVATFWYEFVYFSARPLTEIIAASALFPAAYLLCGVPEPSRRVRLAAGALLGLSLVLRAHLLPAVLVVALAAGLRLDRGRWRLPALSAVAVVLVLGGLLDWITWGVPFYSFWQNFSVNILADKAASFGTLPVYWYLMYYANAWPGLVAVMLGLLAVEVRRAPLLLVVPLVILVSHSFIGHKEYRFLYPGLPFVMTLASIGAADLLARATRSLGVSGRRWSFAALALGWFITSASLAGQEGFRPFFFKEADLIALYADVGAAPEACGLAVSGAHWAETPGYVGLNRDLPLYFVDQAEARALSPAFDFYIYRRVGIGRQWQEPDLPAGFERLRCAGNYCVASRPGSCTPQPDRTINAELAPRD